MRAAVLLAAAAAAAGCAKVARPPDIPAQLAAPAGESLALVLKARGAQLYECSAAPGGTYQWVFAAPEAQLFDTNGAPAGRHYAGPHWEALDGSRTQAAVRERSDAPRPGAIPWLLLKAKPAGGNGAFSRVSSIQRVNTAGGLAPRSACSQENVGETARVPYTADYYFYAAAR